MNKRDCYLSFRNIERLLSCKLLPFQLSVCEGLSADRFNFHHVIQAHEVYKLSDIKKMSNCVRTIFILSDLVWEIMNAIYSLLYWKHCYYSMAFDLNVSFTFILNWSKYFCWHYFVILPKFFTVGSRSTVQYFNDVRCLRVRLMNIRECALCTAVNPKSFSLGDNQCCCTFLPKTPQIQTKAQYAVWRGYK